MVADTALAFGVSVVKQLAKKRIDELDNPDMEAKAKVCFDEALKGSNTWFSSSEDEKFKVGVAALMVLSEFEDKPQLEKSIRLLQALSAATRGVPVDFGAMVAEEGEEVYPLLPWFQEVKAKHPEWQERKL